MIHMFTKNGCVFCVRAKQLMERIGICYKLTDISNDMTTINEIMENPQVKQYSQKTFPFVFHGDKFVGGYNELHSMVENGFLGDKDNDF